MVAYACLEKREEEEEKGKREEVGRKLADGKMEEASWQLVCNWWKRGVDRHTGIYETSFNFARFDA